MKATPGRGGAGWWGLAGAGAPVVSLAASAGAVRLAAKAERRPVLVVAVVAVAVVAGVLVLVEAFTAVDLLLVDDRNGDTCAP